MKKVPLAFGTLVSTLQKRNKCDHLEFFVYKLMNLKGSSLWFLVCHRCECTNSVYKFFSLGVLIAIHDTNRLVALVIHRFELKST